MSWILNNSIRARLSEFDLLALLQLLDYKGFSSKDIMFIGNSSLTSQERIVEDVVIHDDGVDIIVNFGLLGAQTVLPSRWIKKLEKYRGVNEATEKVLGLLDHFIIVDYIASAYPSINTALFKDWRTTARYHLSLEKYRCSATFHWVFSIVFPEFYVGLSSANQTINKRCNDVVFGEGLDPQVVSLGGWRRTLTQAQSVVLRHKAKNYRANFDWQNEIKKRLNRYILPIISGMELSVSVRLLEYSRYSGFVLGGDSLIGRDSIISDTGELKYINIYEGVSNTYKSKPDESSWSRVCQIQP
ncbi:hypothetical protein ACJJIK_02065 [Microbulbifer sp. ZKSA006]|uniref:hypothetical protein n=1 Tax=Microbulbifer sp. ZKSA006 TaxID=3243390 RepID=UPI0040399BC9